MDEFSPLNAFRWAALLLERITYALQPVALQSTGPARCEAFKDTAIFSNID